MEQGNLMHAQNYLNEILSKASEHFSLSVQKAFKLLPVHPLHPTC